MPPTETDVREQDSLMLCLSRHENCPWEQALKAADVSWDGLQYACLKIFHLYCKVFEREDVLEMVIRSTCKACGCDRQKHAVFHEELCSVRNRLGLRDSGTVPYPDCPPGLTPSQAERYWDAISEKASSGAGGGSTTQQSWRNWKARAAHQLPKQDLALSHCNHVDEQHKKSYEDFVAARNEIALDIGIAMEYTDRTPALCMGCEKKIERSDLAVLAPLVSDQAFYHPGCFVCYECDELLVELAHCVADGRVYCLRHYDDKMKPRCCACDELLSKKEGWPDWT